MMAIVVERSKRDVNEIRREFGLDPLAEDSNDEASEGPRRRGRK
jgi:hypothetical protein